MFWTYGLRGRPVRAVAEVLADLIDGSSVGGGTFDLGSATFDMTRIVTGQLDAYVEPGPRMVAEVPGMREEFERVGGGAVLNNSPYDLAAAALCLDEARRGRHRRRGRLARRPAAARLRRTSSRCPASPRPTPSCTRRSSRRSTAGIGRLRGIGLATRPVPRPALGSLPRRAQEVALGQRSLADYTHILGRGLIDEIRELAEPLKGKRVLHVSATAFGGGVSEILYTLVPLMNDVGLDTHWQVILGREEFFNVTKLMHNSLQGDEQSISDEQWEVFDGLQRDERRGPRRRLGRDHRPRPPAGGHAPATRSTAPSTGSGAATSTSRPRTRRRSPACCR